MGYEVGGRADKDGNRYEFQWIIFKLLDVLSEKITYVMIEGIGPDEEGVDIWIGHKNGNLEGQQCKGRNASKNEWDYGKVNAKGIFDKWKSQLDRGEEYYVSLVSPLPYNNMEGLISRARNTDESNPEQFYNEQINKSGTETRKLYNQFCKKMEIDTATPTGCLSSIKYLKRVDIIQWGDSYAKELVKEKIYTLFSTEPDTVYGQLLSFILTDDIKGKRIDVSLVSKYCSEHDLVFRNLAHDKRIFPAMSRLNEEYDHSFNAFRSGMLYRDETDIMIDSISKGESIILHGIAGSGKSGCTVNLIHYLKMQDIPYLAIKLDKRIPNKTAEIWGREMGLPASPVLSIGAISTKKNAVLILDQLDALRWTQSHSVTALNVCMELICEAQNHNRDSDCKISIVMVSRTYDLENDSSIRKLFEADENIKMIWNRISVGRLSDSYVADIVGDEYVLLNRKTKDLLGIPSNLYIWEQLDDRQSAMTVRTAQQLIQRWWQQLEHNATRCNLNIDTLVEYKNRIVNFCEDKGRLYIPAVVLDMAKDYQEYLQSSGFIIVENQKVSFFHQSVLDSLLAERMLTLFYNGDSIEVIIGDKHKQNPARRYQLQMFLQQLLEIEEYDFVRVSYDILSSNNIRFNLKYVVLEICSQIDIVVEPIAKFILNYVEDEEWYRYFCDTTLRGNYQLIHLIRDNDILEKWIENGKLSDAISLLYSISDHLDVEDEKLIERYCLIPADANEWKRVFYSDINTGSDHFFEVRMNFYKKFPEALDDYFDVKSMMEKCEIRTIRFIALLIELHKDKSGYYIKNRMESIECDEDHICVRKYKEVMEYLLPLISNIKDFDEWSARYYYTKNELFRACVDLIKKAGRIYAQREPNEYLELLKPYMNQDITLYNEIILDTLYFLPNSYANDIMSYLQKDFSKNTLEDTSGNGDKLGLAKKMLSKFSLLCDVEIYEQFEYVLLHYIDPYEKRALKERIEWNQENKNGHVYWRFWGSIQKQLLEAIPGERRSILANDLLQTFSRDDRCFKDYAYNDSVAMKISSLLSGKDISLQGWKHIITNIEIASRTSFRLRDIDGRRVESSFSSFVEGFSDAVRKAPARFTDFMITIEEPPIEQYVDAYFKALSINKNSEKVSIEKLSLVIKRYWFDYESGRACDIADIISDCSDAEWGEEIINGILDIALNHSVPKKERIVPSEKEKASFSEHLRNHAYSETRSRAIMTMGDLLWNRPELLSSFKKVLVNASKEENQAVLYGCLCALLPCYNISPEWATDLIFTILQKENNILFDNSRSFFFITYKERPKDIIDVMMNAVYSEDETLQKIAAYTITELFMIYDEFDEFIMNPKEMGKVQINAVIEMLVLYVEIEKYNEKAKRILIFYMDNCEYKETEVSWDNLFYQNKVQLNRDHDFILKLMTSGISRRIVSAFVHYLKKNGNIILYSDIVLEMANNLLEQKTEELSNQYGLDRDLSKLIISLYDECSSDISQKGIADKCLDIWDMMFEKRVGDTRTLTAKFMEL